MAFHLRTPTLLLIFALQYLNLCHSTRLLNTTMPQSISNAGWSQAQATWYGSPDGAGSDGGACGYGNGVSQYPFSSFISAGGPSLYKSGEGCGACYEVSCSSNAACSGSPVRVVITDSCPGCVGPAHFDLSGTAFGALAKPNQADQLRNVGVLDIQYQKVDCNFPGTNVVFKVDAGSNPYYFAVVTEYEDGDGELSSIDLKTKNSDSWQQMQESSGAIWKLNSGSPLQAPFSIRLTQLDGSSLEITDAIPYGWVPGQAYRSFVNFKS